MTMTPSRTLALTEKLIALSSVTPDDQGCQQHLINLLTPLGFVCETIESNGVTNLWARKGTTAPLLVFAGLAGRCAPSVAACASSPLARTRKARPCS